MLRTIAVLSSLALSAVFVPALAKGAPEPPRVTGTVTYRQRSALPPGATLRVQLQDVSRQDAAATIVADASMLTGTNQVPLPFAVAYQDSAIDPAHTYVVRATISIEDRLAFTSTSAYPVITKGAPSHVDILLEAAPAALPTAALEGTAWKLVELAGTAPIANEREAEIQFREGRIAGSGGCNRVIGSYRLQGATLSIEPGGMTMMACPERLMAQERQFVEALRTTHAYRMEGDTLALLEGERVLARFRAGK